MKVLHCIYTLGGGGAERQLAYLATQLAENGVDVHIAFVKGGPNLALLQGGTIALHPLPARAKYDPRMLLDLCQLVEKLRPQLIQTWLTQMDILGGVAALYLKVPFILSERSSRMAYPGSPRNLLRRFVGSKATAIAANSEQGAGYWHQQGFQGISVVIRNSIPFEEIRQVKPCSVLPVGSGLSLSIDQQLMLYAGRYGAEKNLEVLLESLSLALGRCRNSVAALFGAGPMQERMETIHASLANRERIFILGYTKDLWAYMRRAQLFVSLSLFEGNPNVVLEAVAAGCPLVLSDIPAHREILDEKSARLVPATNAHAVAGAIHELLTTSEKAAALAEHARGRISNWCVQGAAREYMDLYNQVLRNREWTHKK